MGIKQTSPGNIRVLGVCRIRKPPAPPKSHSFLHLPKVYAVLDVLDAFQSEYTLEAGVIIPASIAIKIKEAQTVRLCWASEYNKIRDRFCCWWLGRVRCL